jgi:golgin subfamily B member 1
MPRRLANSRHLVCRLLFGAVVGLDRFAVERATAPSVLVAESGERRVERLIEQLESEPAAARRAAILHEVARAYADELGDSSRAYIAALAALDEDVTCVPIVEFVGRLATAAGGLDALIADQRREARLSEDSDPGTAAGRWLAVARWEAASGELSAAIAAAGEAVRLVPDDSAALSVLADLLARAQRWAPLVDVLTRRAALERDREAAADLWLTIGRIQESRLDDVHSAIASYRIAVENDPGGDAVEELERATRANQAAPDQDRVDARSLRDAANAYFAQSDWDHAAQLYERLLAEHRAELPSATIVCLYGRWAGAELRRGHIASARRIASDGLDIFPDHPPLLRTITESYEREGKWRQAAESMQRLASVESGTARVAALRSLAALYLQHLAAPERAAPILDEILQLEPEDRSTLHALVNVSSQLGRWDRTIAAITSLAQLEGDPIRRGKYYLAAAVIHRDERRCSPDAVIAYELALDALFEDPERLSDEEMQRALAAFARIDAILTEQRDWQRQEVAYRRMLRRYPPGGRAALALWDGLAEICRSRLRKISGAISAYEVAESLDPGNIDRKVKLSELYIYAGCDRRDRIEQLQYEILTQDPLRTDAYATLFHLHRRSGSHDAAWCAARALVFLGRATPEQGAFYSRSNSKRPSGRATCADEFWNNLYPAEADPLITAIFAAVWLPAARLRAVPPGRFELMAIEALAHDAAPFVAEMRHTAEWMGQDPTPVYYAPGLHTPLEIVNLDAGGRPAPVLAAGPAALGASRSGELPFICAHGATCLLPAQVLRQIYRSNRELAAIIDAAAAVACGRPQPSSSGEPLAEAMATALRYWLRPAQAEQLLALVKQLLSRSQAPDLAAWREGMIRTADRAAFLACGDLGVAGRTLGHQPGTDPRACPRLADLVRHSVSSEHRAVRRQLGIALR